MTQGEENKKQPVSVQDMIKKPILSCREGNHLGNIRRILLDPHSCRVIGFLLDRRTKGKEERILPLSAVYHFGEVCITAERADQTEPVNRSRRYTEAIQHPVELSGSKVFTAAGRILGRVSDYSFSPEDGAIVALLVSGGGFFAEPTQISGQYLIAVSGGAIMMREEAVCHMRPGNISIDMSQSEAREQMPDGRRNHTETVMILPPHGEKESADTKDIGAVQSDSDMKKLSRQTDG